MAKRKKKDDVKSGKRSGGKKAGSGPLTTVDLIVALENVEYWIASVRHVLELLPPKQEFPEPRFVIPPRPSGWSCLRSEGGTGRPAGWSCESEADTAKEDPQGRDATAAERVQKSPARKRTR